MLPILYFPKFNAGKEKTSFMGREKQSKSESWWWRSEEESCLEIEARFKTTPSDVLSFPDSSAAVPSPPARGRALAGSEPTPREQPGLGDPGGEACRLRGGWGQTRLPFRTPDSTGTHCTTDSVSLHVSACLC